VTAPDQCCRNVRKFLPGRRPHVTQVAEVMLHRRKRASNASRRRLRPQPRAGRANRPTPNSDDNVSRSRVATAPSVASFRLRAKTQSAVAPPRKATQKSSKEKNSMVMPRATVLTLKRPLSRHKRGKFVRTQIVRAHTLAGAILSHSIWRYGFGACQNSVSIGRPLRKSHLHAATQPPGRVTRAISLSLDPAWPYSSARLQTARSCVTGLSIGIRLGFGPKRTSLRA